MPVFFHSEELQFGLEDPKRFEKWILKVIENENMSLDNVSVIFAPNDFLLKINQDYLNHNYFTDVITFNYNLESQISGDIFVSIDQVKLNSEEFGVDFDSELSRVIIHGILHLLGYNDLSKKEIAEMRRKEDEALKLLESM